MKKLRAWFKPENVHWALQTLSVATFGWLLFAAVEAEGHPFVAIFDALIAGFAAANFVHNILHRQRSRAFGEMVKIAEDQNAMLREIGQIKSAEIAVEIAAEIAAMNRMQDGRPLPANPPTKH